MLPTTTPFLLLCLAILVSTAASIPPAFVAPLPASRHPYRNQQPLLLRQPFRGVVALSSSSPQKEDVSKMEAGKPGPGGQPMSLTTANATAAAFNLLVDTIQNWATVIEDRQELSKEEIIDRLDEWMHKVNGDQRMMRAALEKLNKDVNRVAILVVICFGVSLATIAPAWFAAK